MVWQIFEYEANEMTGNGYYVNLVNHVINSYWHNEIGCEKDRKLHESEWLRRYESLYFIFFEYDNFN